MRLDIRPSPLDQGWRRRRRIHCMKPTKGISLPRTNLGRIVPIALPVERAARSCSKIPLDCLSRRNSGANASNPRTRSLGRAFWSNSAMVIKKNTLIPQQKTEPCNLFMFLNFRKPIKHLQSLQINANHSLGRAFQSNSAMMKEIVLMLSLSEVS